MAIADLERLLASTYLGELRARPIDEVRAMRADCQTAESKLSYVRRLAQGRLDIVTSELRSRASGAPPADAASLVADLPSILSDRVRGPGLGRLPVNMHPPEDDLLTAELDAMAGPGSLEALSDEELAALSGQLHALETEVSSQRQAIFEVIDALEGELAERYRNGSADPSSLLG